MFYHWIGNIWTFAVLDCQGVTFIGVVEKKLTQENCLLIKCHGECQFDTRTELSEGVSVKITRAIQVNSLFTLLIDHLETLFFFFLTDSSVYHYFINFNCTYIFYWYIWHKVKLFSYSFHVKLLESSKNCS